MRVLFAPSCGGTKLIQLSVDKITRAYHFPGKDSMKRKIVSTGVDFYD